MNRIAILMLLSILAVSCGEPPELRSAEFLTMRGCLEGIRRDTKQNLKVITDKPDIVSGRLTNGKNFGCRKKMTGTKGTYYLGWYESDR